ncbi:hypothetical protein BH09MYX1_BH09MYX1_61140 [soil metagenome]
MMPTVSPHDRQAAIEGVYATAHWLFSQERYKDAADVFRAMVTMAPEDERGWVGLGMCHEGAEQLRIAKEIYAAGTTLAKSPVRCAIALVRVLKRLGDDDAAVEILSMAEEMSECSSDEDAKLLVDEEKRAA